jgi:hypothetical protein
MMQWRGEVVGRGLTIPGRLAASPGKMIASLSLRAGTAAVGPAAPSPEGTTTAPAVNGPYQRGNMPLVGGPQ